MSGNVRYRLLSSGKFRFVGVFPVSVGFGFDFAQPAQGLDWFNQRRIRIGSTSVGFGLAQPAQGSTSLNQRNCMMHKS